MPVIPSQCSHQCGNPRKTAVIQRPPGIAPQAFPSVPHQPAGWFAMTHHRDISFFPAFVRAAVLRPVGIGAGNRQKVFSSLSPKCQIRVGAGIARPIRHAPRTVRQQICCACAARAINDRLHILCPVQKMPLAHLWKKIRSRRSHHPKKGRLPLR